MIKFDIIEKSLPQEEEEEEEEEEEDMTTTPKNDCSNNLEFVMSNVLLPSIENTSNFSLQATIILVDSVLFSWKQGGPNQYQIIYHPELFFPSTNNQKNMEKYWQVLIPFFWDNCIIPSVGDPLHELLAQKLTKCMIRLEFYEADNIINKIATHIDSSFFLPILLEIFNTTEISLDLQDPLRTLWCAIPVELKKRSWCLLCGIIFDKKSQDHISMMLCLVGQDIKQNVWKPCNCNCLDLDLYSDSDSNVCDIDNLLSQWSSSFPSLVNMTRKTTMDIRRKLMDIRNKPISDSNEDDWIATMEDCQILGFFLTFADDKTCSNSLEFMMIDPVIQIFTSMKYEQQFDKHMLAHVVHFCKTLKKFTNVYGLCNEWSCIVPLDKFSIMVECISDVAKKWKRYSTWINNLQTDNDAHKILFPIYDVVYLLIQVLCSLKEPKWFSHCHELVSNHINLSLTNEPLNSVFHAYSSDVQCREKYSVTDVIYILRYNLNPDGHQIGNSLQSSTRLLIIPTTEEGVLKMCSKNGVLTIQYLINSKLVQDDAEESQGIGIAKTWLSRTATGLFSPSPTSLSSSWNMNPSGFFLPKNQELKTLEEWNRIRSVGALLVWYFIQDMKFPYRIPVVYLLPQEAIYSLDIISVIDMLFEIDPEMANEAKTILSFKDDEISALQLFMKDESEIKTIEQYHIHIRQMLAEKVHINYHEAIFHGIQSTLSSSKDIGAQQIRLWYNSMRVICAHNVSNLKDFFFGPDSFPLVSIQAHCGYSGSFHCNSNQVKWFWECMNEFDDATKLDVYHFITGEKAVGNHPITIRSMDDNNDNNSLPTSQTCFNVLILPLYEDKKTLRKKLLLAVRETGTTGLTLI